MTTAIYQRASDIMQEEEGVSIETQSDTINKFIEYKGFKNIKTYTEIKSARSIKGRYKMQEMMQDIEKGYIKRVIIYRLDRLTRSLRDLMNLLHLFETYSVELHSTHENIDTSTPAGRMLVQVLGIIAEWESANTSARVSASMRLKSSMGIWQSSIPYGFDLREGKLIINKEECETLNNAFDDVISGRSFHDVEIEYMFEKGIKWYYGFLRKKVEMPSTMGHIFRNGELFKNTHEALISERKQSKLLDLMKHTTRTQKSITDDLFRGKITCPDCNNILSVGRYKRYTNKVINRYNCHHCYRKKRKSLSINEPIIKQAFIDYMKRYTVTVKEDDLKQSERNKLKEVKRLNERLNEITKERDRIQRAWIKSIISEDDLLKYQEELNEEEKTINNKLDEQPNREIRTDELKEIKMTISKHFDYMDKSEQREFIQSHIKEISISRELVEGYKKKYDTKVTSVVFL